MRALAGLDAPPDTDAEAAWPGKRLLPHLLSASSGTALPANVRAQLEAALGIELGDVRVHTDDAAVRSAAALRAKAFTIGQAVYFNRGFYDPTSVGGRRLIA
ncbi:MAG: DUF4157 domain-containing protein, partial [Proteobacteria bacterium]|nr:DUF4157 domain-containing protein [Pseudomonadota bacterium]